MAVAEITNIVIDKGTDFEATFNIFNDDNSVAALSDVTVTAKIRKYPSSPKYALFTTSINASKGSISIFLTKEQTAELSAGRNFFDILVTKSEATFKVLKGTIIVEESSSV